MSHADQSEDIFHTEYQRETPFQTLEQLDMLLMQRFNAIQNNDQGTQCNQYDQGNIKIAPGYGFRAEDDFVQFFPPRCQSLTLIDFGLFINRFHNRAVLSG